MGVLNEPQNLRGIPEDIMGTSVLITEMCPGLCDGPKANWHRKACLHAIELSLSPEQQGYIQLTSWEPVLAGAGSSTVPGIVWGER